MHYINNRSHRMQKHKFGETCPGTLFVESIPVPSENEKLCADVSCPKRTRMHYMNRRSHRKQKHTFGITCPDVLFVESVPVPQQLKK
jgi:hypothetical protein